MSAAIQAVEALLQHHPAAARSFTDFEALFNNNDDFLTKVKSFDLLLDQYRQLDDIGEYLFDLLMIHHLEKNNSNEDYFDSPEWLAIEDKTLERGTELLNILLYISESKETDAPVSLDDFLYEFLLVDEDEFQDEHRIYESLIEHNELVDEDMDNIRAVANELPESSEIKELFVPIVLFFQHADDNAISNDIYKILEPVERSLLACLLSYKQV